MHSDEQPSTTRRDFLHQATGLAACLSAAGVEAAEPPAKADPPKAEPRLPTIKLGKHEVTRLIIGGNPIYGYSHFNKLLSQHMVEYHTPERVIDLLKRCEKAGLNCWQNSYAERTLQDLDRYREAGGTMHWLCLGKPDWDQHPDRIADAAKRKPIGIAPHGALGDRLYRDKKLDVLGDLLKRIRDEGVLVGLSAHNPALVELAEEKGWPVDYYMCCLYNRTRTAEELRKLLGTRELWLLGLIFLLMSAALNGVQAQLVPLLIDQHMDAAMAAWMLSIVGLGSFPGRLLVGFLLDRAFAPLVALGFFLPAAIALLGLADGGLPLGVALCAIAIGLSLGAENDLLGYLVGRYFDLKWFGQIYGVLLGAYLLGAALGPYLMARTYAAAGSYNGALRAGSVAIVVSCALLLCLRRYSLGELHDA